MDTISVYHLFLSFFSCLNTLWIELSSRWLSLLASNINLEVIDRSSASYTLCIWVFLYFWVLQFSNLCCYNEYYTKFQFPWHFFHKPAALNIVSNSSGDVILWVLLPKLVSVRTLRVIQLNVGKQLSISGCLINKLHWAPRSGMLCCLS